LPVTRNRIASEGPFAIERVSAAAHESWQQARVGDESRCVLPGIGLMRLCTPEIDAVIDPLTAIRLEPGRDYQLRQEGRRDNWVVCRSSGDDVAQDARAWLVRPRELLEMRRAVARLGRGDATVETVCGTLDRMLARSRPLRLTRAESLVLRARRYLAARAQERMNTEELAEEVRCSPFHLIRVFKRELGMTPHQYRIDLRLAAAMKWLEDGDTGIADLAHGLGFSSQSHFGETVRRAVGLTPGQMRAALT